MNYKVPHNYLNWNFEISHTIVIKDLITFEISGRMSIPVHGINRASTAEKVISWFR